MVLKPLHDAARASFDARAAGLATNVTVRPRVDMPPQPTWTRVDTRPLMPTSPIRNERQDLTGQMGEISWSEEVGDVGLFADSYVDFVKLVEDIQRTTTFRDVASTDILKDELFRWITDAHRGLATQSACDRLSTAVENAVEPTDVWVPIYELFLETDLPLGRVVLKRLSLELLGQWEKEAIDGKDLSAEDKKGQRALAALTS